MRSWRSALRHCSPMSAEFVKLVRFIVQRSALRVLSQEAGGTRNGTHPPGYTRPCGPTRPRPYLYPSYSICFPLRNPPLLPTPHFIMSSIGDEKKVSLPDFAFASTTD